MIRRWVWAFVVVAQLGSTAMSEQSGTGLNISGAVDMVGTFGGAAENRLDIREAEFMLYAPIDHYFDGVVSFAAHNEGGALAAELHGAFLESSKLIPRSRIKMGQYFLGIGRLHQYHRHDWPFITAPRIHSTLFGEEAILDTGIEYVYLTPLPFFLEFTLGVTNGWVLGHAHAKGTKALFPTHYLRGVTYVGLPGNGGMQIGLNYLGNRDSQAKGTFVVGADITAKWREAKMVDWLLQSEVWYRAERPLGIANRNQFGFYVFPEHYLGGEFFLGLRFDYFNNPDTTDPFTGAAQIDTQWDLVPQLSWAPSEFSKLRLAYTHTQLDNTSTGGKASTDQVELQAIFILGAHPAHDF